MQSKAVNGYTAAQVDRAIAGLDAPPKYRFRFESLDAELRKVRDLTAIIEDGSRVFHNSLQDIKRSAELKVREQDLAIAVYNTLVNSQGPLFYWRLGEASGSTAIDASVNGRHGTYNGGVTYAVGSLLAGLSSDTAVKFNGSTGYVSVANASWMNVTALTLACWVKGTSASKAFLDRDDGGANRFFRLDIDASGNVKLTLNFTSGSPNPKTFTATVGGVNAAINDGNAHLVHATYDGVFVRIYVDSNLLLKTAETRTLNTTGTLGIRCGSTNAGTEFADWTFDEVAMWSRALTASEIRDQYQAGSGDLSEIDYFRDRIKVWAGIQMQTVGTDGTYWAEWPLGVFVLSNPGRTGKKTGIIRTVVAQDQTRLLSDDRFTTRWTINAAANYITGTNGILAIIQSSGFDTSTWSITSTTLTLPSTLDFEVGSSKLEAVNYLLQAINYRPLRFKSDGTGTIQPYVLPASRSVEDTLQTDSSSIIDLSQIDQNIELDQAKNSVVLARSNPDATAINSFDDNRAVTSPISIPRLAGRTLLQSEQVEAADQSTLDALASRRVEELAQVFNKVVFKTALRPFHEDEDKITLRHLNIPNAMNISADFIEEEWSFPLDPTQLMEHTFRTIPNVG